MVIRKTEVYFYFRVFNPLNDKKILHAAYSVLVNISGNRNKKPLTLS